MAVLFTDLDGTMIFSHRLVNESNKDSVHCVEYLNGSPTTYMTYSAINKLKKISQVIPVTTRTTEQFKRIEFFNKSEYAVVCNGGKIFYKGSICEEWNAQINSILLEYDLEYVLSICEGLPDIISKPKIVEESFIYVKSGNPDLCTRILNYRLNTKIWEITRQGSKVYIIPKMINKGNAVKYICENILTNNSPVISAGDTSLDISMLEYADYGIVPGDSEIALLPQKKFIRLGSGIDSADRILEFVLLH